MEHFSCEERLRQSGVVKPGLKGLWEDITATFQYLKGPIRKMGTDFLAVANVIRQNVMILNCRRFD